MTASEPHSTAARGSHRPGHLGDTTCDDTVSDDEAFVDRHLPMVRSIARTVHRRLPDQVRFEDLEQAGLLGLLEARERFDPERGARFSSFAWYRVRGAIFDALRRATWLPPRAWRALRELERRDELLAADLPGDPTELDDTGLAARFDQTVRHVATTALLTDLADPHDSVGIGFADAPAIETDPAAAAGDREASARLRIALDHLPDDQRELAQLLYFEGLSTTAAADRLGLHKSSVSRAHGRLLDNLGAALQAQR